ncbi:MAG: Fe-S protein assembly co-chaperone HscB, partial [Herminiimonas sp.]|nr:Fe-S protein assembly co-chaperone HscB [Herminiimonas sp.]
EAYQTLKSPLKRATYLCQLHGVDLQVESNTSMSHAFLMQQMEWRESLEGAKATADMATLESLEGELRVVRNAEVARIAALLDANAYQDAAEAVRQLMFLEKFGEEVAASIDLVS